MRKRVLIPIPIRYLPGAEEILGREVEIVRSSSTAEADLLKVVGDVHGIVANAVDITERIIQNAPLVQIIATGQAGFERIDVEAATRACIPVVANTGVAPEPVAEFVLGLMIAFARRIIKSNRDLHRERTWAIRNRYGDPRLEIGVGLSDCTIGIVGFGHIGSTVARLCKAAFSPRMLAYDPFIGEGRMTALGVEKADDILKLAREVDFLLLHVLLTKETRYLINGDILRAMKPTSYLINCARGGVVEEAALFQALKEGWIAGAALDVFEQEPIRSDHPLLGMDQVVLTPHIAGVTLESSKKRGSELARRVLCALAGERPDGLVNPEVWPRCLERSGGQPK